MDSEATLADAQGARGQFGVERETLRRLSRRSDVRGLLQLGGHALLLAATGFLVWASRGTGWLVPAIVLHGAVLDFLFCALHESVHGTAFASRRLNEAVAALSGALLLLPPRFFRYFHFAHHRFTQDPVRDPELAQPAAASLGVYLWRASGLPNWGRRLSVTLRHALTGRVSEPYIPADQHQAIVREARLLWACYVGIAGVSLYLQRADALLYWVLPAMAGQPFLRLYLMAEHTGCELSGNTLRNTRTTFTNAFVHFVAWRMPFHVEHHCFPSVPFHALAELHRLLAPQGEVTARGYLTVHRGLLRQFRARAPRA